MNLKILSLLTGGLVTAGGATTAVVISKKSSDTQESNEEERGSLHTEEERKDGESQPQSKEVLGSTSDVEVEESSNERQEDSSLAVSDRQLQDGQQKATTFPQQDVSVSETHK